MQTLTDSNFDAEVASNSQRKILVDFWAPWCGPCKMLEPVLKEIEAEAKDTLIAKINIDDNPRLVELFHISHVPTLLVCVNGEVVGERSGALTKRDIIDFLDSY